jgi:FkbM family methyltransferase
MTGFRRSVYDALLSFEKVVSATALGRKLKRTRPARTLYGALYRSFQPTGTVTANAAGLTLRLDPGDLIVTRPMLVYGTWEPFETQVFLSLLEKGMRVVDIGANIGYYALLAARAVGHGGRVYAFEPTPRTYELLCQNVQANGFNNVVTVQKAVANRSGTARLYLDRNNAVNTLSSSLERRGSLEVEVVTLEQYFAHSTVPIDVLKMDIEGSEPLALEGMADVLNRTPEIAIFTELNPTRIRELGRTAEGYVAALRAQGFRIFLLDEEHHVALPLDPQHTVTLVKGLMRAGRRAAEEVNLLCLRGERWRGWSKRFLAQSEKHSPANVLHET